MKEEDEDFTVMRIKISGEEKGTKVTYTYYLLDKFQNKTMSMARTTGYTCTAAVNLLAEGMFSKKGISPPEYLGPHFDFINNYLAKRNVIYHVKKELV